MQHKNAQRLKNRAVHKQLQAFVANNLPMLINLNDLTLGSTEITVHFPVQRFNLLGDVLFMSKEEALKCISSRDGKSDPQAKRFFTQFLQKRCKLDFNQLAKGFKGLDAKAVKQAWDILSYEFVTGHKLVIPASELK